MGYSLWRPSHFALSLALQLLHMLQGRACPNGRALPLGYASALHSVNQHAHFSSAQPFLSAVPQHFTAHRLYLQPRYVHAKPLLQQMWTTLEVNPPQQTILSELPSVLLTDYGNKQTYSDLSIWLKVQNHNPITVLFIPSQYHGLFQHAGLITTAGGGDWTASTQQQ